MEIHSRCYYDFVAAFNGNSTRNSDEIGRYCGNQTMMPPVLKSESNIMTLQFHTDHSVNGRGSVNFYLLFRKVCETRSQALELVFKIRTFY